MIETQLQDAVLLLEDGTYFRGKAAGKKGIGTGEICFNTGMTGYQEIFTDPSYFGQILVTTNAHIGNYGISNNDQESEKVQIAGLVCKNFTNEYSRPIADIDIQKYFEENNIACIHQLDTRAIVRYIRDKGAMNCLISTDELDIEVLKEKCKEIPSMSGLELASQVSTKEVYTLGNENADIRIAVLDFGTKRNILNCFVERGAYLKVYPAKTEVEEILKFGAHGFFLSNGPGDPASMDYAVKTIKSLLQLDKPMFGICLGHQLLALANDIPTYKMHNGHRGINHPVKNMLTGYCEITSQNHGFGVSPEAIKESDLVDVTHINLNDDTIEGIQVKGKPAFSVQYHPESSPGPHDSRYLFDQFIDVIKKNNN
jgi:carbamoyl-phosphate synthase small subunit